MQFLFNIWKKIYEAALNICLEANENFFMSQSTTSCARCNNIFVAARQYVDMANFFVASNSFILTSRNGPKSVELNFPRITFFSSMAVFCCNTKLVEKSPLAENVKISTLGEIRGRPDCLMTNDFYTRTKPPNELEKQSSQFLQ